MNNKNKYALLCAVIFGTIGVNNAGKAAEFPDYYETLNKGIIPEVDTSDENELMLQNTGVINNSNYTVTNSTKKAKKAKGSFTGGAATLPTLNTLGYETTEYMESPVMHELTKTTGNLPNGVVDLIINGESYYYTPSSSEDAAFLQLLASYANKSIIPTTDVSKAIYKYNDTMYTYDTNNLPLSVYKEIPSTSSDYNYATYTTDAYGAETKHYYNINMDLSRTKLEGVTWEKVESGSDYHWVDDKVPGSELKYSEDGTSVSGVIRFNLPYKSNNSETEYYKFTYNIPSSYTKAEEKMTSSEDVSNVVFYKINGGNNAGSGVALTINADGKNVTADFIGNYITGTSSGSGAFYTESQ